MMKYFQMELLEEMNIIIPHKSQSDLWGEGVSPVLTHEPIHHKIAKRFMGRESYNIISKKLNEIYIYLIIFLISYKNVMG